MTADAEVGAQFSLFDGNVTGEFVELVSIQCSSFPNSPVIIHFCVISLLVVR